ncbi:hypothetical protein MMC07_006692 [Pseudocyphellaria aurata]|nr:hypothetical protein [Pseudocyphellaria aurata]
MSSDEKSQSAEPSPDDMMYSNPSDDGGSSKSAEHNETAKFPCEPDLHHDDEIFDPSLPTHLYRLCMETCMPDTPTAVREMRGRLLEIKDQSSQKVQSPRSLKPIRYINADAQSLAFHNEGQSSKAGFICQLTRYTVLGHSPISKLSKWEFYRRMSKDPDTFIEWAQKRDPDIDEKKCRQLLRLLEPSHQNPWLSNRNDAAHKVRVDEAKDTTARQGKHESIFSFMIRLITVHETDEGKYLDEIAFEDRADE